MAVNEHRASGAATFLPEVLDKAASASYVPHIGSTRPGTEKRLQTMGQHLRSIFGATVETISETPRLIASCCRQDIDARTSTSSGSTSAGAPRGNRAEASVREPPIRQAAYDTHARPITEVLDFNRLSVIEGYARCGTGRARADRRIYADEGKSGLVIDHCDALKRTARRRRKRPGRFRAHSRVRRQPMGTFSGYRRECPLRVHVQVRRHPGVLLPGAV